MRLQETLVVLGHGHQEDERGDGLNLSMLSRKMIAELFHVVTHFERVYPLPPLRPLPSHVHDSEPERGKKNLERKEKDAGLSSSPDPLLCDLGRLQVEAVLDDAGGRGAHAQYVLQRGHEAGGGDAIQRREEVVGGVAQLELVATLEAAADARVRPEQQRKGELNRERRRKIIYQKTPISPASSLLSEVACHEEMRSRSIICCMLSMTKSHSHLLACSQSA